MLGVSPNTLRAWERRFGFPQPVRTPGRHRLYSHAEVEAVRDALQEGLSIGRAVARARDGISRTQDVLLSAVFGYDAEMADRAMEGALVVRSVEDAVQLDLVPILDMVATEEGIDSPLWGFASLWAAEWLARTRRYSRAPTGARVMLLLGDPAGLTPAGLHAHVLHLMLVRENLQALPLPAALVRDAGTTVAAFDPAGVVAAGPLTAAEVQGWSRAVRKAEGRDVPLLSFGETRPVPGWPMRLLPLDPVRAARAVADIVTGGDPAGAAVQEPEA